MISIGPLLIFAVAVSIIVSYVLIIHRSLSGDAANNPEHDASATPHATPSTHARSVSANREESLSGRGTPKHA